MSNSTILRLFLVLFVGLIHWNNAAAQTYYGLNGYVVDEEGTELVGATVLLLNLPDSTMEEYALSNEQGLFKITAPKGENYLLQISYMGYETYEKSIQLTQKTDLGRLILKEKSEMLESVEVTEERIPIRMKGDTLEYAADAFETQEHDNVEELLKKLPGVQVDRDGKIKAQGENVDRILVDGKEFFGDNPQMATKNLPADAVDKVQVYDRKSEMAEFSGVDDGVKRKTINLKLKEDKKHGFFGHLEGGYGHNAPQQFGNGKDHRYKGNLSLNYFNPSMRVSTIGAINNINEQSFNFEDYINLMGGLQSLMSGGGNINLELNGDDPLGALLMGNNDGVARTIGGGVNFNWFISDKTDWSTHYFYTILNKEKEEYLATRSIGLNSFFSRNQWLNNQVNSGHHNINSTFKHEFDPTQDLKVGLRFKFNNSLLQRNSFEQSFGNTNILQNDIEQVYQNQSTGWGINANTLYRKKLKKKGRTFMANVLFGYSNKNADNENLSTTGLYNENGVLTLRDSLNQTQDVFNNQQVYGAEVSFIEPIGKKNFLDIKLVGMFHLDNRDKKVFDIAQEQAVLNPFLTNLFQKQYHYQTLRARFQRTEKPYTLTIEGALQRSSLLGVFSGGQANVERTYYYPLGGLSFEYKFSQSSHLSLNYSTNIKEPQIQQLQPILDNSNPLSLFQGNPNLNPEYHHNVSFRYNLFDQFSFSSFFANVSFSALQHQIVNNQTIDANLRIAYRPENSPVGYRANIYLNYSRPIKPLGIKFALGLNGQLSHNTSLVNDVRNEQLVQNYTFRASIENRKKKVVDVIVGTRIDLNNSTFSVNNSLNTTYLNYMAYVDARVTIAKKWQLGSDFQYNIYADPSFEDKIYIPMWSAFVSRTFMKGNQLKIELRAMNLLDQRVNIQRFGQGDMIAEQRVNTLGRYFMLSLRYKLTQVGAKQKTGITFEEDRIR